MSWNFFKYLYSVFLSDFTLSPEKPDIFIHTLKRVEKAFSKLSANIFSR